jgi:hypothetical protein
MMSYDLVTLLAGLRAIANRAEKRAELVTLPPSKLHHLLDKLEPLVPAEPVTRVIVPSAPGDVFFIRPSDRLRVAKYLGHDNRQAAIAWVQQKFSAAPGHPSDEALGEIVDAIEADMQEGTQNAS